MKRLIQSRAFVFAGVTLILSFGVAILCVYAGSQTNAPQSPTSSQAVSSSIRV